MAKKRYEEEWDWDITNGPGRFDFAVAYFRDEEVYFTLNARKENQRSGCARAKIKSAVPRVGNPRNSWIIWGEFKYYGTRYFYGDYNLQYRKGLIQEVTEDQYRFLSL